MERTVKTKCSICTVDEECRHFAIYSFGSEGVWLRHRCELMVSKFISDCATIAMRVKREYFIENKRKALEEAKDVKV